MNQKNLFLSIILASFIIACQDESSKESNNSDDIKAEMVSIHPLEDLEQVDKLLSTLADKPQVLSAPSNKVSTIRGAKGTLIYVDPDRLETMDGSPLGESIQIELLELTDFSSLIFNNAPTVSNNELLITGGAYYLNMLSDGKQLKIKQGKGIEVEFPILTEDEMELFLGERDSLDQVNWIPTNKSFTAKAQTGTFFSDEVKVIEPTKPLERGIDDSRIISIVFDNALEFPELQHYENVEFRVNDDCEYDPNDSEKAWHGVKLSKSMSYGEYVIVFYGREENGKKIEKKYVVTPVFESDDYQSALKDYEARFDAFIRNRKAEVEIQQKSYEAVQLLNFGWINCDRFSQNRNPRKDIELIVDNDSIKASRFYAVFTDMKSIINAKPMKGQKGHYLFENIPEGMDITIIGIAALKEKPYFFQRNMNTKSTKKIRVKFKATSQELIQQKIQSLN